MLAKAMLIIIIIIGIPTILLTLTLHELKIRHSPKLQFETVLVMQGGGSLGAYECGVYKTLTRHGIKFDIVAGTSDRCHQCRNIGRLKEWSSRGRP